MRLSTKHLGFMSKGPGRLSSSSSHNMAPIVIRSHFLASGFGLTGESKRNLINKCELDADWAARPVALTQYNNRLTLVLEDPGGAPLDRLLGRPLDVPHFLRIAIPLATVLRQVHERGLIHKDIKPANILVDAVSGGVDRA
jgi:serine/threonine protein kinase